MRSWDSGNRQFGAVKTSSLLRHLVEVHVQAIGQLADRHGHATGTEIVAALDQTLYVSIPQAHTVLFIRFR